ncbi:HPr family phosphocarrier protein [Arthrobacter silvisoli]|uniref:HPr family phosphocarrier protein n=1 Tax=Arthrobacter silvisoli TaxID=2291022 RepID=UPI000E212A57|nr:HPr family phosphocarrier protein [Arthrobacter silvisoli]
MAERIATIASRVGLHARPAAVFTEAARGTGLDITIAAQDAPVADAVDASSILALMSLGIHHGDRVVLRAEGPDAEAALDALSRILETDHDA